MLVLRDSSSNSNMLLPSDRIEGMNFFGWSPGLTLVFRCSPVGHHDCWRLLLAYRTNLSPPVTMQLSQVLLRLNHSRKTAASIPRWHFIAVRRWGTDFDSLDKNPSVLKCSTTVDGDTPRLLQADVLSVTDN